MMPSELVDFVNFTHEAMRAFQPFDNIQHQTLQARENSMDQLAEFVRSWELAEHTFLEVNRYSICGGLFGEKNPFGDGFQG